MLKARNVHIATNKDKLMLILFTSKTHDKASRPQRIKITSNWNEKSGKYAHRYFCPFHLMQEFLNIRGDYLSDDEQFFTFRDKTPVTPTQVRAVLHIMITNIGLDPRLYGMHSFRIGRTTDLAKYGYPIDEIKLMGRWRSNVIFKYIRQ